MRKAAKSFRKHEERDGTWHVPQADPNAEREGVFLGMTSSRTQDKKEAKDLNCQALLRPVLSLGRLSLGGLLSSRARLRFAGRCNVPRKEILQM